MGQASFFAGRIKNQDFGFIHSNDYERVESELCFDGTQVNVNDGEISVFDQLFQFTRCQIGYAALAETARSRKGKRD